MTLEAIRYQNGKLSILDQLLLPLETKFIDVCNTSDGWSVIKKMQVRGAPAIAIVGCLSLAVELLSTDFQDVQSLCSFIVEKLEYLVTSRPTAVNMAKSAAHFSARANQLKEDISISVDNFRKIIVYEIEQMLASDIQINKTLSRHGADDILKHYPQGNIRLLTHCNTGSLATAGYGTALGVARTLYSDGKLEHVYCTETRPYNQGARLTAYELVYEKIPATLICDDMVSMCMLQNAVSAVVVGADRVVANGDTANKIGTYQLAIAAKYHKIPFYVACPVSSFDPDRKSGAEIVIEDRPAQEMTSINGVPIAAPGIGCWNPAFDVTPAELITGGIITEFGVYKPEEIQEKLINI